MKLRETRNSVTFQSGFGPGAIIYSVLPWVCDWLSADVHKGHSERLQALLSVTR